MKMIKRAVGILLSGIMLVSSAMLCASENVSAESEVFFDDFESGNLDSSRWLVAFKNWGGKVTENGVKVDYNGGVLPQNVEVKDGKLILHGNGNLYDGEIRGINRDKTERSDGKRTGAAIATKEYFSSGSYEVYAKIAPELGVCSAIWTFEYEEDWDTGEITNHEIDIEMPGRPSSEKKNQSFQYALCNTWTGENEGEYKTGYTDIGVNQADGKYHKYRFDWHTGDETEEARVEFYFDDKLIYTSKEYIPTNEGRLWIGLWFPNSWAGIPDFETADFEIDYVKITPFHEKGDTKQNETYPDDGWGDINDIVTYSSALKGDINSDGRFDEKDLTDLQKWILNDEIIIKNSDSADVNKDGLVDEFDLSLMRSMIDSDSSEIGKIYVKNTDELKNALENAKAGDEIILAEGEYVYSGSTAKGFMFKSYGEGTEDLPIIIRSENPQKPAVLSGISTESNSVLAVFGDWWEIRDLKITNGQKGIIIDNSNHTKILNCEVYNTGSEGIHFRDNSSYCLAENCYVHDTGVVSPGYGEAVYIGSAKNNTTYGFDCHYNTVRGCRLGPNVSAEHVDVKEYTIGTVIEDCIFDGTGMSGENSSKSFVNIKGNDCILRNNTGYRKNCDKITRAFEQNQVVDGWGQNAEVYGNKVYMDTSVSSTGKKMYFLNSWDCSCTVWDNYMAYEDDLFSVDNEADHWNYYNCNLITYGKK